MNTRRFVLQKLSTSFRQYLKKNLWLARARDLSISDDCRIMKVLTGPISFYNAVDARGIICIYWK